MTPVRLGAVGYLNARPLVYGLERSPRFTVRFDVPSTCAALLHEGGIDVGLIPSIEYLRGPAGAGHYRIVPDVAIASRGAIASVALYTTRPISDVRSIAMDTSSRTSIALVGVLCARLFKIRPAIEPRGPDVTAMLAHCDAALLIGDNALLLDHTTVRLKADTTYDPPTVRLKADATYDTPAVRLKADTTYDTPHGVPPARDVPPARSVPVVRGVRLEPDLGGAVEKIDLGEAWTRMTGLPFVYAFWAGRAGALTPGDVDALQRARDAGVGRSDEIAREYFGDAPERQAIGARYLRDNTKYDLGAEERAGLELFYRYAAEIGAVPSAGDLRFY